MMTNKIKEILTYLDSIYPDAHCELDYTTDYSLLIAVMLSAQATDASVNKVTPKLFATYKSINELAEADVKDVINIIKSLGLANNKGKRVVEIAKALVNNFNGKVPTSMEDLMSLPGVGVKTANVVRCELFKIPSVPVDTHVERVSKRLKLAKPDDSVLEVEKKLERLIPKDHQILSHHQFIFFGRYFCKAISPKCAECQIRHLCVNKLKSKN